MKMIKMRMKIKSKEELLFQAVSKINNLGKCFLNIFVIL